MKIINSFARGFLRGVGILPIGDRDLLSLSFYLSHGDSEWISLFLSVSGDCPIHIGIGVGHIMFYFQIMGIQDRQPDNSLTDDGGHQ